MFLRDLRLTRSVRLQFTKSQNVTIFLSVLLLFPICLVAQTLADNKSPKQDPQRFFAIEYRRNDVLLPVELSSGDGLSQSTMAILDTGSARSYLSTDTAQLFRLASGSVTDTVDAAGQKRSAEMVRLPRMKVGPRDISKLDVVKGDLKNLAPGVDVDMLIGADLMQRFVMTINFPERKMALSEKPLDHNGAKLVGSIPFEMKNGLPTITCSLPGAEKFSAILDTGYEKSLLILGEAAGGLHFVQPTTLRREQSFNGSMMDEEHGEIESIRCGDMSWGPLLVARLNEHSPGARRDAPSLVGNEIFDRYLVEFDFPNRKVTFFCPCR